MYKKTHVQGWTCIAVQIHIDPLCLVVAYPASQSQMFPSFQETPSQQNSPQHAGASAALAWRNLDRTGVYCGIKTLWEK